MMKTRILLGVAIAVGLAARTGWGVGIQGTMSNFDVFNETGVNVYGAELDLDGVHLNQVTKTYPCHFSGYSATEYTNGSSFGVKLLFTGYNFVPGQPYITTTTGISTNGHYAVNLTGCEHFGFSTAAQPTQTSFYWLDSGNGRVGTAPLSIPMTTWNYVPPVGAQPAVMKAVMVAPKPAPAKDYPDAVWMKIYEIEAPQGVNLEDLISMPLNAQGLGAQLEASVEQEWELIEWDSPTDRPDVVMADTDKSVVRRFEYYKYTGAYLDASEGTHLPNSAWAGGAAPPPANELGQFISANMVAANMEAPPAVVPEAGTLGVMLGGAVFLMRRRK